jgi:hypothetical protein
MDEESGFHLAIDNGDCRALYALVDYLLDRDDPRADGYRYIWERGSMPLRKVEVRAPWSNTATTRLSRTLAALDMNQERQFVRACGRVWVHYLKTDIEQAFSVGTLMYPLDGIRQVVDNAFADLQAWASLGKMITNSPSPLKYINHPFVQPVCQRLLRLVLMTYMPLDRRIINETVLVSGKSRHASSCWQWLRMMHAYFTLIPKAHLQKFVDILPTDINSSRREMSDAFAKAFVK